MKKEFYFLFLLIILNLAAVAQQDPQFSFNKFTDITVNPGRVGSDGTISGLILNRYQWVGFDGAPKTLVFNIGALTDLMGVKSGVGLNILSDEIGFSKSISVKFNYAYRAETSLGNLGVGFSVGFQNESVDGTQWYIPSLDGAGSSPYGSTQDGAIPQSETSQLAFDAGAGVLLTGKNYYAGVSVTHLNQASITFENEARTFLARHYYLSGGGNIAMDNPLFELQPSFYFKTDMAAWQLDLNADLVYNKRFSGGIGYRINDAVIVRFEGEMKNGLRIGYAYDITTSVVGRYGFGSHEIFLHYTFDMGKGRYKKYKSVRFL
jgi:type IX secretion system PorP/SprF family membrane protein